MVLKRKIYKSFLDWKANWAGKRALLVQGARRIGKSTIVEEFAKNEYETYILINFQSDLGKIEQLFKNDISDLDTFFRNLSLLYGKRLIERTCCRRKIRLYRNGFAHNVKAERGKDFDSERREVYKYVSARF